jgi:O-methyltransferase
MTGLLRLEDLQQLVEQVVNERIEGDLIEVGSWRGGASILMRAALDALGAEERRVWVADSFKGFPAPERQAAAPARYPATVEPYLAAFDFLAAPLDEVKQNFARFGCDRGVEFVEGFFADTLPRLQGRRWSLVRLDADTYDSTMLALSCLYPGLSAGGHLVVDDYGALEECRAAVEDFRSESRIEAPLEAVDEHCVRWRKGPAEELERRAAAEPPKGLATRNQPMPRGPRGRVPSARELELAERTEALERQLSELRSELARTRASASWRLTRPLRELASYIRARQR